MQAVQEECTHYSLHRMVISRPRCDAGQQRHQGEETPETAVETDDGGEM